MLYHYRNKILPLIVVLCLAFCGVAQAEQSSKQCAIIEVEENALYQLKLLKINGGLLFRGVKTYNRWRRTSKFTIPDGTYEFIGSVVDTSGDEVNAKHSTYFALTVEENTHYKLNVIKTRENVFDVTVQESPAKKCDQLSNFESFIDANNTQHRLQLRDSHRSQLQSIFSQMILNTHGSVSLSSIVPAGYNSEIGLRFNKYESSNNAGLEVRSVTPASKANNLGLSSGDKILAINGRELKGSYQEKHAAFYDEALDFRKNNIQIKLERNDQILTIENKLNADFIPRYHYAINPSNKGALIHYFALPASTRYQLDSFIVNVIEDYREEYQQADEIVIHIPKSQHLKLGVTGIRKENGISVNFVAAESLGEQLGILQGDLLLSLGDESVLNSEVKLESNKDNNHYSVTVKRNEKNIVLSKVIEKAFTPEINLSIDIQTATEFIETLEKELLINNKLSRKRNPMETRRLGIGGRNSDENRLWRNEAVRVRPSEDYRRKEQYFDKKN